jgi:hypothetical protein
MNANRLLLAALLAVSCGPNLSPTWPSKTGDVTAALSSVSLAQDCGAKGVADFAGACAVGQPCPSFCRQSNLQLSLVSTQQAGAKVEVRAVRLLDKATGAVLDTLTAKNPQQWTGAAYAPWDQIVGGGVTLKVTFDLSAPDWNKVTGGNGARSYGATYRVQVDLAVDGAVHTLEVEAQREPEVVT